MGRVTLEELQAREPDIDEAKLDATTEDDIRRYRIEDGFDPDADIPAGADAILPPREVRRRLAMTQERFASVLGVPLATYRNWEQGRTTPDPAARTLLKILAREPEAAMRALGLEIPKVA